MIPLAALALSLAATPPPASSPDAVAAMRAVSADRCRADVESLAAFGTRHTFSDTESTTRGIGAARRWIRDRFEEIAAAAEGSMTVDFESFDIPPGPRVPGGANIVNVIAVKHGSMPLAAGRACYVVGHYDSRNGNPLDAAGDAPGANDNASGTAVVLECARVLASIPTDATIVFLATAGEEQGLLGARAHAEAVAADRRWTINGVLNNDIVGDPFGWSNAKDPRDRATVRLFSEGLPRNPSAQRLAELRAIAAESDSPSRQLARYVSQVADIERTALRPRVTYRLDRFLRGGDHSCFSDAGFSAVRFTAPKEEYNRQHQDVRLEATPDGSTIVYGDLPRFVDPEYLADVARLNAAVLVHLANAPSSPGDVRVLTEQLETSTTLRWAPSPEPDVAGYEVVWRETTSPTWDHARDVGIGTQATIELSKDDWFFGVRAYDRDGYRSPVSFAGAAPR